MGVVPGQIVNALDNIMVSPDKPLKKAYAGSSVVTLTTGDYMDTKFTDTYRGDMLYFPSQEIDIDGAGTYTLTPPSWAKHIAIFAVGGGKGGGCGNGGNRTAGKGGAGGNWTFSIITDTVDNPISSMSVRIGRGGAGGTSGSTYGKNGTRTYVTIMHSNGEKSEIIADPGTKETDYQNGDVEGMASDSPSRHDLRIYNKNRPTATTRTNGFWTPSTFGFGDGEYGTPGTRGGGGPGGHGGIFNNYAQGGAGGDGYVYIHYMGSSPFSCAEYMKRYAEHFRATTVVTTAFRKFLTDRGITPETCTYIPFYINTQEAANLTKMFFEFKELRFLHDLDFSSAVNASSMFEQCENLRWGPKCVNANKLTNAHFMFTNTKLLKDRCISVEMNTKPSFDTSTIMIGSAMTYPPFYSPDGQPYF